MKDDKPSKDIDLDEDETLDDIPPSGDDLELEEDDAEPEDRRRDPLRRP